MNETGTSSMHFGEQAPEIRQFRLSTVLGLTVLAAIAFALFRVFGLEGLFLEYGRGFRRSPMTSSINLVFYVLIARLCSRHFRALSMPSPPSRRCFPLNGAFFGTLCGASLFATTAMFLLACLEHPFLCGFGMLAAGLIGTAWASVPAVLLRIVLEPLRPNRFSVGGNTAFGAILGAATGFVCISPVALLSVPHFLGFGLVPALVGAACGARGAYLQVVAERHLDRPIRVTIDSPAAPTDDIAAEGEAIARSTGHAGQSPG